MIARRLYLAAALLLASTAFAADKPGQWIKMFDGKTLDGWKANENDASWTVKNGVILGDGEKSHLFYMKQECEDCEFKAMVKLGHGGNSGMYFRTAWGPGFPKGYEAQVNNTHGDWRRTGSLYHFSDVKEQLIQDDTWWEQHIIAKGNHIIVKIDGKEVVNYVDDKNTYTKGFFALQQHNKGSVVEFKDLMYKVLPK